MNIKSGSHWKAVTAIGRRMSTGMTRMGIGPSKTGICLSAGSWILKSARRLSWHGIIRGRYYPGQTTGMGTNLISGLEAGRNESNPENGCCGKDPIKT